MSEHLYVEKESYYGILTPRPMVPREQVWVFERRNNTPISVWAGEEEGSKPPQAPWLKSLAMRIYKFQRTSSFLSTLQLFEEFAFPIRIGLSITITLVDPVSYMEVSEFEQKDNQIVEAAIRSALRSLLSMERQKQLDGQVSPLTLSNISLPSLRHLLPGADLSQYIQDHPAFRKLGIRVRIIIEETSIPSAYNKLLEHMTYKLKEEYSEVKQRFMEASVHFTNQENNLAFRIQMFTSIAGYYSEIHNIVEEVLKSSVKFMHDASQKTNPPLASILFKDLISKLITEAVRDSKTESPVESITSQQPTADREVIREIQIEALFSAGREENWILSPQRHKVHEVIFIRLDNNFKLELYIPRSYPKDQPVVKARFGDIAIKQKKINDTVRNIMNRKTYDLEEIIKAVIDDIFQTELAKEAAENVSS